ncbi:hypothetical protein V2J09_005200 [Rumex salicifolius]
MVLLDLGRSRNFPILNTGTGGGRRISACCHIQNGTRKFEFPNLASVRIGLMAAAAVTATTLFLSTSNHVAAALQLQDTETLSNIPPSLSGEICSSDTPTCKKPLKIQRPKSRKAETCTVKCLNTCIRGGGEGPFTIRRPIVVFKQGFRSRLYWLEAKTGKKSQTLPLPEPQPLPLRQNEIALTESQALVKFKESLKPVTDQTTFLPDWNPFGNPSPCLGNKIWVGVICYNERVWGLKLQNMGLSGTLDLDALVKLGNLRILSVFNNKFQGPLPDLKRLTTLRLVYFSNNSFSGNISDDAFLGMHGLRRLFLSNNNFTGRIPSSLTRINRLVELRLEGNQFVGSIPDLSQEHISVNVSNNQLEGPVPIHLMNLTADSFSGNKGLCGPPLEPCPGSESSSGSKAWLIILLVVLVLLLVFVILVASCRKRKSSAKTSSRVHDSSNNEISKKDGQIQSSAPDNTKVSNPRPSRKVVPEMGKLVFVRDDIEQFDLAELLRASAEVLGSGHFGSSYKALLPNGKPMVVKRFRHMNRMVRHDFHDHVVNLGKLRHPNILPIVAYYYRKEEKLFILDFVVKGSLASKLHGNIKGKELDWPTRLKIIQGVAKGMSYLHSQLHYNSDNIPPHGHLKSSNVLLNDSFEPLIMDYGLIPLMNQDQAQQVMLAYKSPEFGAKGNIAKKTDVWCLGILILEILTGKFPTSSLAVGNGESNLESWVVEIASSLDKSNEVFDKDMGGIGNAEKEISKLLKLGISCCQKDLDKRFDMDELVKKIGRERKTDRMGEGEEVKTREANIQIQERGEIFMLYRPKVNKEEARSEDDVQRLYMVLRPESKPGDDRSSAPELKQSDDEDEGGSRSVQKETLMRLIVMGRKSLPPSSKKGRPHWGFVELVTTNVQDLKSALQPEEYETSTRGHRQKPAARAMGEGVYRIVTHISGSTKNTQMHTHLIYKLRLPVPTPHQHEHDEHTNSNTPQHVLNVKPEASFLLQIKNPTAGGGFRGVQSKRKATFPATLQGRFGNKRYAPAHPPDFLNYEGCELLLISASGDISNELGIELKTELELSSSSCDEDEDEEECMAKCSSFLHTFGQDSGLPTTPLFQGTWA